MRVFAVDPGRQGGYALLIDDHLAAYGEMSIHPDQVDAHILDEHAHDLDAFCFERSHAMPNFTLTKGASKIALGGSKANWLRGYSNGFFVGWTRARNIQTVLDPTGLRWQKAMLDGFNGATTKERSIECARYFYPDARLKTPKGRVLDGVADAINLAVYTRRILKSERIR